jgi:hypothetical protein
LIGKDTSMSYHIHVEQKKTWNYLAGVNWTSNGHWGRSGRNRVWREPAGSNRHGALPLPVAQANLSL